MKFRYYIVDTNDGTVVGTNSRKDANYFAGDESYFVIDSEEGQWMMSDNTNPPVEALGVEP